MVWQLFKAPAATGSLKSVNGTEDSSSGLQAAASSASGPLTQGARGGNIPQLWCAEGRGAVALQHSTAQGSRGAGSVRVQAYLSL